MQRLLIGLSGPARSGKTTAQRLIADRYGLARLNFADPLKDGIQAMFDLSEAELNGADKERPLAWLGKSPRELLQLAGTDFVRNMVGVDTWIRLAERRIAQLEDIEGDAFRGAVFSDARFDDEAEWIRRHGGIVIHLVRANAPLVRRHASEAGITRCDGDIAITNSGAVDDLAARLGRALDDVLAKRAAA